MTEAPAATDNPFRTAQSEFMRELIRFNKMSGKGTIIPTFYKKSLNLFHAYLLVKGSGGYDKLTESDWRRITSQLDPSLANEQNAAFACKNMYERHVLHFEQHLNFHSAAFEKLQLGLQEVRERKDAAPPPMSKKEEKKEGMSKVLVDYVMESEPLVCEDKPGDKSADSGSEDNEYEVEAIIGHAFNKKEKKYMYFVKWLGYTNALNTWEPAESFSSDILIKKYKSKIAARKEKEKASKTFDQKHSDKFSSTNAPKEPKKRAASTEYSLESNGSGSTKKTRKILSDDESAGNKVTSTVSKPPPPAQAVSPPKKPQQILPVSAPARNHPNTEATARNHASTASSTPEAARALPKFKTFDASATPPTTVSPIMSSNVADKVKPPASSGFDYSWSDEHLIPQWIHDLESWDAHVEYVRNIDNKLGSQEQDGYRATVIWKQGVLQHSNDGASLSQMQQQQQQRCFLPIEIVKRKMKDKLIEFFFKNSRFVTVEKKEKKEEKSV